MNERTAARSDGTRTQGTVTAAVTRHPVATFQLLVFAITGVLAALPIPDLAFGPIENFLEAAVPAVVVTAVVDSRAGLRDLAGRALRWRVSSRWYAASLLALPGVLLVTSFLPTLVFMTC